MTLQATFCATLVDEWVRGGVRHAVIAPGSRSAPLAIAIVNDGRLRVHVRLDERSAAFFALGLALDSGGPVVVLTTSGTAAAELHAAVIEADLARVPLIVVTADRPFELHFVGAPQAIEQHGIFGGAVRFAADPGVADAAAIESWRSLASRLVGEATASLRGPGPVHLNLPLRDPLVGVADDLPPGRPDGEPWHAFVADRSPGDEAVGRFVAEVTGRRGILVVGGPLGDGATSAVVGFAELLGWPVLADPRALARGVDPPLIAHADGIVRSASARSVLTPEVVVHLGSPHASKMLGVWGAELASVGVPHLLVDPYGAFEDPDRDASVVLRVDPISLLLEASERLSGSARPSPRWLESWRAIDDAAGDAIASAVDETDASTEPGFVRAIFDAVADGSIVFASSSMPVRDLEWFSRRRVGAPHVVSNRGANGIDGVTSTLLGVATSAAERGERVVGVIGDLALLYDLSGLVLGTHEAVPDVTIVVIDNAGGGIFSFLPYPEVLEDAQFERLFGTPQRPDIATVVRALGHTVVDGASPSEVASVLASPPSGIVVVVVHTDRGENVDFHHLVERRVTAAIDEVVDRLTST